MRNSANTVHAQVTHPGSRSPAGVTPGIRAAWPNVPGRTRSSLSWISRDRPGNPAKLEMRAESAAAPRPSGAPSAAPAARCSRCTWSPSPPSPASPRTGSSPRTSRTHARNLLNRRLRPLQPLAVTVCFQRRRQPLLLRLLAREHLPTLIRHQARPACPIGVNRSSALSIRRCSRNSAREVNMRYGSSAPLVIRSSIRIPV